MARRSASSMAEAEAAEMEASAEASVTEGAAPDAAAD